MNTKELKTKSEEEIKTIVDKFVETTGLDISYIKTEKEKSVGFATKNENIKVSIILE